jgi:FkbM family methyltransferase
VTLTSTIERAKLRAFELVMHARPEQLGIVLKHALKIGLRVKRTTVRDGSGHQFFVDPMSPFGLKMLRQQPYEEQMGQLLRGLLRPGDTFLDLGANEGYFSVIASRCVGSEGKVFSVEPQSALQGVLSENVRINDAFNVRVYRLALSDKEGEAQLFRRSSINHAGSRIGRRFRLGFGSEAVPTQTLGQFCREQGITGARVIKIDCEGAEIPIVEGSPELFQENAFDVIALEYHPGIVSGTEIRRVHDQLARAGYLLAQWNGQTIYYRQGCASDLAAVSPGLVLAASL